MTSQTKDSENHTKGNYAFVSLGCPKNTVDSERMLGLLQLDGYQLVGDPTDADFVVVNTCGFIEQARRESYGAIDEMIALKNEGVIKGVVVSGCLAERQKEELLEERPEIDSLVGVFGREEVTKIADRLLGDLEEQRTVFHPAPVRALPDTDRLRITPPHLAYLKISEGCDRLCTFCDIPRMRGKHATKPIEQVIIEANQLANDGVRELNIVAQDTTYYGIDLYGEPRLAELIEEIDSLVGIDWVRLLYFYPMYITDRLIEAIAKSRKVIPYIDMPLQHINDAMLKRMSRRVNRGQTEDIINRLRAGIPGLTLRTTFITGFPGETDEQFEELLEFVKETKFERIGVFTYSFEEYTPSSRFKGHIPEEVKLERQQRLMEAQREVVFERNTSLLGATIRAIIDRPHPQQQDVWIGRTKADAPDIDCLLFVTSPEREFQPGEITDIQIVASSGYDLSGIPA
ncbi:MAG: 30S ribosomal protein S12 methylthiotransferase RimO [Planctomycetaceae bacterium]|nr:30S ribosomal protein S12 methylthiotransferase RimO [Planctomycetaceae bacterium]